jgi:alpha,alpha-trehalose phosphorylase
VVEANRETATYSLPNGGEGLPLAHFGEAFELGPGQPVEKPIPEAPRLDPPIQPAGRAPARRLAQD